MLIDICSGFFFNSFIVSQSTDCFCLIRYNTLKNAMKLFWIEKDHPLPPFGTFSKRHPNLTIKASLSLISVFTFKRCLWYVQPPYELTHRTYATTSSPPTLWPCSAFPSSSSPSSTSASSKSSRFTVNIQCSFAKKLSKQKF